MRYENVDFKENDSLDPATLSLSNPREKWLRKRTHVKLRVSMSLNIQGSYGNWVGQHFKWSLISQSMELYLTANYRGDLAVKK